MKVLNRQAHTEVLRSTPKEDRQIALCQNKDRFQAESYIQAAFYRAHQAQVVSFLPYLLGIKQQQEYQGVIGTRGAHQAQLFVEQYLSAPIESYFAFRLARNEIAELGNLCSSHNINTQTLFVVMTAALYEAGYKQIVFCATDKVNQLIRLAGARAQLLAPASEENLKPSEGEWGSYYQHNPCVCSVSLEGAQAAMQASKRLSRLRASLDDEVNALALVLAESREVTDYA